MQGVDGLADDRVDLGVVLLHVFLRELEEAALGFLHEVVDVDGGVKGLGLDVAGEGDELSGQELLLENLGVLLDVRRRGDMRGKLDDVVRASDIVDGALTLQFVGDGKDVDGLFLHVQGLDGLEDLLVARVVEGLGTDKL